MISDDENSKDDKTQLLQQGKEIYVPKRMHCAFMRGTEKVIDNNNSCLWVKEKHLKKETEGLAYNGRTGSIIANKMGKIPHR